MSELNTAHPNGERLKPLAIDTFATVAGELVLDDVKCVWWVESGEVDVFLVEVEGDRVVSGYKHVTRAAAGRLLFGAERTADTSLQLCLKGLPGFRVHRLLLADARESLSSSGAFAQQADVWIEALSESVARDVPLLPKVDTAVGAGEGRRDSRAGGGLRPARDRMDADTAGGGPSWAPVTADGTWRKSCPFRRTPG